MARKRAKKKGSKKKKVRKVAKKKKVVKKKKVKRPSKKKGAKKKVKKAKKIAKGKKATVRKAAPQKSAVPSVSPAPTPAWTSPAWGETEIGIVEHFFGHLNVAAVRLRKPLKVGETIHFKGHTTDFKQKISSMQVEHETVTEAPSGSAVGILVDDRVREHDILYRVES